MAFLTGRDYDIFISYAHYDNIPDREGEKGWVERFERLLKVRLLKLFGEPVDVWRDPELERAQLFDNVIEKAINGSGVMISLLSNRYSKSDYCAQEAEWFRGKAEGEPSGLVVDDYLRIFPVLLYNIPRDEWPDPCKGASAFRFHDAEGEALGQPLDPDSEEFETQLRGLVEELHTVLNRLQEKGSSDSSALPEAAGEEASGGDQNHSFAVFLSCPADDLRPTHRRLAAGLEQRGIEVIGGASNPIPPPEGEEAHEEAVIEALERANLSVHLLGAFPGEPLDEAAPEKTYPLEQASLALEHADSQLILMPEDLEVDKIEPASYAAFVKSLWERERQADRLELVQTGRHQMLDEIVAKRRNLEEATRCLCGAELGPAFIDLHTNDVPRATDLVNYLIEKRITPMMVPTADSSPTMSIFEETVKNACLFIVVFGAVAKSWVDQRLEDGLKLIVTNNLPLRPAVYIAPPRKQPKDVRFPGVYEVLSNMDRFDPTTVDALLQAVGGATA